MYISQNSTANTRPPHCKPQLYVCLSYAAFFVGLFFPLFLLAAFFALFTANKLKDNFSQTHVKFLIQTCKWGSLWLVISAIALQVLIGYLLVFVAWFWCIWRVIKGGYFCFNGKPLSGLGDKK